MKTIAKAMQSLGLFQTVGGTFNTRGRDYSGTIPGLFQDYSKTVRKSSAPGNT